MIILPKGSFMVLQDEAPPQTEFKSSLILSMNEIDKKPDKPNTGIIKFANIIPDSFIGYKVKFRANYADPDPITIDGVDYLFFRDFESSIFYVTKD